MAGEVLKKKREELGLDLREVSELLKLKAEYLSSIEEDRFEKLPVAVYTIGYIRCYAAYLQVDPEPIISIYTGHLSHPQPSAIIPVASSKKKVPFYYYVIPALVILLIALAAVIMKQGTVVPQTKVTSAPVQSVQVEKPQPAPPAQEAVAPAPQVSPPAVNTAPPPQKTASAAQHRLEVTATDLTWVYITFAQGEAEEALLRPGTSKTWKFSEKAMLKLGNAGGVRMNLDGKDIGTPGSNGQVMTISFPENRQVMRQVPAAPAPE